MNAILKILTTLLIFSSCGNVNISRENTQQGFEEIIVPPPPPPPLPEAAPMVVRVFQSYNNIRLVGSRLNNSTNLSNLTVSYEKNFSYSSPQLPAWRNLELTKISDINRDGYDDYCLSYKEANGQFVNRSINTLNGETLDEVRQDFAGQCAQVNGLQQLIQISEKFSFSPQGVVLYDPAIKVIRIYDKQSQVLIQTKEISVKTIDSAFDNLVRAEVIDDINRDGFDDVLFSTYRTIPNSFNYKVLSFILSGKTLDTNSPLLNFQSDTDPRWMHKIHFSRKHLTAWIDSNEKVLTVFKLEQPGSYQFLRSINAPQGMYFSQSILGDGYNNKELSNSKEISLNLCNGQHVFNWRDCNLAIFDIENGEIRFGNFSQYSGFNLQEHKGLFGLSRTTTADDLLGCSSSVIDFNNDIYATQIYSEKNKKILVHTIVPEGFWPAECFVVREIR